MLSEFEILERLGKGHFGEVFKAKQRSSGTIVAIKRCVVDVERSAEMINELSMLRELRTPYCTRLYGCYFSGAERILSIVMVSMTLI